MSRIYIGIVVLFCVAGCDHTQEDPAMANRDGKGHFSRIMQYIEEETGEFSSYDDTIDKLRDHPSGYRRALSIYFSDADIDNGGFHQYYHNGFGCMTMSAIEGYERLGASQMVNIMKSALHVCLNTYPEVAQYTNFKDVPDGYFDDFTPVADTFDELDSLYYKEADRLPGSEDVDSMYPIGPIDYYYDKFPDDFKPQPNAG